MSSLDNFIFENLTVDNQACTQHLKSSLGRKMATAQSNISNVLAKSRLLATLKLFQQIHNNLISLTTSLRHRTSYNLSLLHITQHVTWP